jgi:hypothetical protein
MRNLLSLYMDTSQGDADEMHRLIEEIEQEVRSQFTDEEISALQDANLSFKRNPHMLTLSILEHFTGYTKESISRYRSGDGDMPYQLVALTRVLHHRVHQDPELAYQAVMDWLKRKRSMDLGAV